ncbi:centromere protein C, partial [Cicer arietinum]
FSLPSSEPFHDFDSIHNHLRSMALQSPAKLVEQAKSISEDNYEFVTENLTQDVGNDVVVASEEGEEFPRKRRPGLGLNRARPRFSLKPTKKPSVEDLLPILDLKALKDPVEFFAAHEKRENAKREIQKQLGFLPSELNQDSNKPRERRPGLPGLNRRPIRYRHRSSTITLDNNDDVLSSQEAFESDSINPVNDNTDKDKASLASLDTEVTGSSAIQEKEVNDVLQGLLSCNSEDLEGDGAMNLLQERLQIKPIVPEILSVPDFPDYQPIDLKLLRGNLSKPRKALSDVDNLLKGINIKTPLRRDAGCIEKQLASPTPPRSPFASLLSLQKHISQSKPSVDPFATHEIDHVSTRNYSPTHMIHQEVNTDGSSKLSNELSAPIIEDVIAAGETNKILDISENSKEDNSGKSSDKVNALLFEDRVAVTETSSVQVPVINCTSTPQKSMVDNSREPEFDANVDLNEHHVDMDVDIGGSGMRQKVMDDTEGTQNIEPNEPYQFEDKTLEDNSQELTASISTDSANFNLVIPLADQSNPVGFQASSMNKQSRRSDDGPEQCLQEKTVGSVAPVNGQKRVKLRVQKESKGKKKLVQRKSLADAGTSWESGVRRSTRFRTRPLEYWKGERMVYGRVHQSLTTVIGVKCMSPGSDGKPTMKVKSFVSDKYKELFEIASLH